MFETQHLQNTTLLCHPAYKDELTQQWLQLLLLLLLLLLHLPSIEPKAMNDHRSQIRHQIINNMMKEKTNYFTWKEKGS